jgi:hypothetical protein
MAIEKGASLAAHFLRCAARCRALGRARLLMLFALVAVASLASCSSDTAGGGVGATADSDAGVGGASSDGGIAPARSDARTDPARSDASGTHSVSLQWTASTTPGVTYDLLRSTVSGGPYTQLQGGIISTATTDPNVTAGVTYYYVARSQDSSGQSVDSNEVKAVIP